MTNPASDPTAQPRHDLLAAGLCVASVIASFVLPRGLLASTLAILAAVWPAGHLAVSLVAPRLRGSLRLALALALSPFVLGVVMTVLMLVGVDAHTSSVVSLLAIGGGLVFTALRKTPDLKIAVAPPLGRPGLAVAFVLTALVAWPLAQSNRVRTSIHGMLHSSLLFELMDRGAPPGNPFFAGQPLRYYWTWHLAIAAPVELSGVDPTIGFAATNVAAALAFLILLGHLGIFLGSIVFDEERARRSKDRLAAFAILLGFTSLNPLGAFLFPHQSEALGKRFSPLSRLAAGDDVIGYLQALKPGEDDRISATLTKFFNVSSFPGALALLAAAWLFSARTLRHRTLGDFACTLLAIAGCIALSPITGLSGGLALGLAGTIALLANLRDVEKRNAALATLGALAIGLVASLPFVLLSGGDDEGSIKFLPTLKKLRDDALALAPAFVLALPAIVLAIRRARTTALALVLSALALPLLAVALNFPVNSEYKLVREAAPLLGVFLALAVDVLLERRKVLFTALAAAVVLFFLPTNVLAWNAYRTSAQASLPVTFDGKEFVLDSSAHPVEELYDWIRKNTPIDAVLLDDVDVVHHFAGPFHGAEAPALAQRAVFTDTKSYMNDFEKTVDQRLQLVRSFFSGRPLDSDAIALLESPSRPIYAIVRADSPRAAASAQAVSLSRRFERVFDCAAGRVYRWKSK